MDLFERAAAEEAQALAPLAERMRPKTLDEFIGQEHLTGPGRLLRHAIETDSVPSMIFWGPPGTGKTTLAQVIAHSTGAHFESLSAVLAGVKDLREAVAQAQARLRLHRKKSILFVDEIHRFNKAQQDALLPHVEKGTITLLGATTENPSFEINSALLSRMRVLTLRQLEEPELRQLLHRALTDSRGFRGTVSADADAVAFIAQAASGDARRALTSLEVAANISGTRLALAHTHEAVQQRTLLYDKSGEEHFNVVSAFIKSMRASDPDAAVYWLARMLEAGEDPRFVVRRMVIFASEDVGNADPQALQLVVAALHALELIGLPEGTLALTQAVTYLAMAPKTKTALTTYAKAKHAVATHGPLPVPLRLRNSPAEFVRQHISGGSNAVGQTCLPDGLGGERYFFPSEAGAEAQQRERLAELLALKAPREPGESG